ncbi:MAG: hypothetical protein IPO05_17335 [Flavobacteriales bacterium]|nr:hypothetical protein [Flavobacteriales bacterium]
MTDTAGATVIETDAKTNSEATAKQAEAVRVLTDEMRPSQRAEAAETGQGSVSWRYAVE